MQGLQEGQEAAVERDHGLGPDAAVPLSPRDYSDGLHDGADTAASVSEGSPPADGTSQPPAQHAADTSISGSQTEPDSAVTDVAAADDTPADAEHLQPAHHTGPRPLAEGAGQLHTARAAVSGQLDEDVAPHEVSGQLGRSNGAPAASDVAFAAHARQAPSPGSANLQQEIQGPALTSEAAPHSEREREAGNACASEQFEDHLPDKSLPRIAESEPSSAVASPPELLATRESTSSAAAEPVPAAQQPVSASTDGEQLDNDTAVPADAGRQQQETPEIVARATPGSEAHLQSVEQLSSPADARNHNAEVRLMLSMLQFTRLHACVLLCRAITLGA